MKSNEILNSDFNGSTYPTCTNVCPVNGSNWHLDGRCWVWGGNVALSGEKQLAYACSHCMVLDINSGLVAPPVHVKFDDLLKTTRLQFSDVIPWPTPAWKILAGLIKVKSSLLPSHVPLHQAVMKGVTMPWEGGIHDGVALPQEDTIFE